MERDPDRTSSVHLGNWDAVNFQRMYGFGGLIFAPRNPTFSGTNRDFAKFFEECASDKDDYGHYGHLVSIRNQL